MNLNDAGNFEHFEDIPEFTTHVLFVLNRDEIMTRDFSRFLKCFDMERLKASGKVATMFGRVNFSISGFDHDERGVFEIPETRWYLRELVNKWPYFFYADALITGFLCDLLLCMVNDLTVGTTTADPYRHTSRVEAAQLHEAVSTLQDGLTRACMMHKGMTDEIYNSRLASVEAHVTKIFGM